MNLDLAPLLTEVLKLGFAGVVITVLFLSLRSRDKSFLESQEKRITESQANTERFLTALNAATEAQKQSATAFSSLKEVIEAAVLKKGGR